MLLVQCSKCMYKWESNETPRRCVSCYYIGKVEYLRDVESQTSTSFKEMVDVPTPFLSLNQYLACSNSISGQNRKTGGFRSVGITLLGGPPNIGKSIFLIQFAKYLSEKGNICVCAVTEDGALRRYQKELMNVKNVHILDVADSFFDDIERFVRRIKPQYLFVDSIDETKYFLPSYGAMGLGKLQNQPKGSPRQTVGVIKKLHQISKEMKIPVYAASFVDKDKPLTLSGAIEKFYLSDDVFILLHCEGEESSIKQFYVKKRRDHPTPSDPFYLKLRKGEDGKYADIMPGVDLREIISVIKGNAGAVLCASLKESKFKQLLVGETVIKQTLYGDNIRSEWIVPDKDLQTVKACMELLQIHADNLMVQSSIVFTPLSELSVLAACYSLQQNKSPLGKKALFIGQVDIAGNVLPLNVDPWVSSIHIPFDCKIVGNFSKMRYPFTKNQARPIYHIDELEHVFISLEHQENNLVSNSVQSGSINLNK